MFVVAKGNGNIQQAPLVTMRARKAEQFLRRGKTRQQRGEIGKELGVADEVVTLSAHVCERFERVDHKARGLAKIQSEHVIDIRQQRKQLAVLREREEIDARLGVTFAQKAQRRLQQNDAAQAPKFDDENALRRLRCAWLAFAHSKRAREADEHAARVLIDPFGGFDVQRLREHLYSSEDLFSLSQR